MSRLKIRLLLFATVFLGNMLCADDTLTQDWHVDYNAARRASLEKGRPLIILLDRRDEFWCSMFGDKICSHPDVAVLVKSHFVAVRVNASEFPKLAELLKVRGYPTTFVARSDGRILASFEGFKDPAKLCSWLEEHRQLIKKGSELSWHDDLSEALRASAKNNRPVLAYFTFPECFWAREMELTTFRAAPVIELLHRFTLVKINIAQAEPLAEKMQIQGCPTLIIFNGGEVVMRREGCQSPQAFCDWLSSVEAR